MGEPAGDEGDDGDGRRREARVPRPLGADRVDAEEDDRRRVLSQAREPLEQHRGRRQREHLDRPPPAHEQPRRGDEAEQKVERMGLDRGPGGEEAPGHLGNHEPHRDHAVHQSFGDAEPRRGREVGHVGQITTPACGCASRRREGG